MISDDRVQIAMEELQDLKGVWNELLKIWEKIDEMKEQPWLSVQPRKVRHFTVFFVTFLMCMHVDFNPSIFF
jgi:hypothetical protein